MAIGCGHPRKPLTQPANLLWLQSNPAARVMRRFRVNACTGLELSRLSEGGPAMRGKLYAFPVATRLKSRIGRPRAVTVVVAEPTSVLSRQCNFTAFG